MFNKIRQYIAIGIAPEYFRELENRAQTAQLRADQRLAKALTDIDPFELVLKRYNGVFTKEYQRPEESLDAKGQLQMKRRPRSKPRKMNIPPSSLLWKLS